MFSSSSFSSHAEVLKARLQTINKPVYTLIQTFHVYALQDCCNLASADELIVDILSTYGTTLFSEYLELILDTIGERAKTIEQARIARIAACL